MDFVLQKVILGDLKGSGENGIRKEFIHVRIDVSGSPLECAGDFLFMPFAL